MAATRSPEFEAKFLSPDLDDLRDRVVALGGKRAKGRTFERNLLFDTRRGRLRRMKELLRLRHDTESTLTYKRQRGSIEAREEIEVRVEDPETTLALLQAIGFRVAFIYEKYRRVLEFGSVEVMLDELPFGDFVEVEGPSLEAVRRACRRLGLRWERRLSANYQRLFEALAENRGLDFRDATFGNFAPVSRTTPQDLEAILSPDIAGDAG